MFRTRKELNGEELNGTIPLNRGGKSYTMNEVFDVWYANQDKILNSNELPVKGGENYKLGKPREIYHLEIAPRNLNFKDQDNVSAEQSHPIDFDTSQITTALEETKLELSKDDLFPGNPAEVQQNQFRLNLDNQSISNSQQNLNQNQNQSSIQGNQNLNQGNQGVSASALNLPPGLSPPNHDSPSPNAPLLTSDRIEWFYLDPLGTEQGPFNGDLMQEWLSGGYLDLELRIRRKEERTFNPLKQLCEKVQNYVQPFKVPLPDLSAPQAHHLQSQTNQFPPFISNQHQLPQQTQLHQFLSNGPGNLGAANMRIPSMNSQSNLFGSDFINPDPFAPNPLTPSGQSAYPTPGSNSFHSNPSGSNQFSIDQINHPNLGFPLNMPTILQQQLQNQQHHHQPGLSRNNSGWGLDTSSNGLIGGSNPSTPVSVNPVLPGQINQPTPMSPWLSGVQSSSRVSSPFVPNTTTNDPTETNGTSEDHVLDEIHTSVVTGILNDGEEERSNQQFQAEAPAEVVEVPEASEPISEPIAEPVSEQAPEPSVEAKKSPIAESLKPAVPSQQELAPWAITPTPSGNSPTLTLKQIQALEAERLEKQKQLQNEIREEQLQQQAALRPWSIKEEPVEKPFLPKTSSWATAAPSTPTTQKSLAEIQKEEAEAAALKAKSAKAKAAKITSAAPLNTTSFASALANSVPEDISAWTTVSQKKPVVKKVSSSTISSSIPVTQASPQLLRSVSANRPITSGVNNNSIREEFLIWARSSMTNLYPTVSKDDLLDIFITLPAASADSSSLISETIYSSSATMDGRRFAQEFLKRRQKVDQQIGKSDDVAWSSAIISSADKSVTVDEDGWSTSVKSKKKGRK